MDRGKIERLEECNEIIKIIASHGRKFFNYESKGHDISKLEIGFQERVYFIDGFTGTKIYTHRKNRFWRGFSEGGALKGWVEAFRDYITFGTKLNINGICQKYFNDDGNTWGYPEDEAKKMIDKLKSMPAFKDSLPDTE